MRKMSKISGIFRLSSFCCRGRPYKPLKGSAISQGSEGYEKQEQNLNGQFNIKSYSQNLYGFWREVWCAEAERTGSGTEREDNI